ncbi:MAG: T9SS type A sorting domain-containing protein, partial [Bacteroidota bacterium]
VMYTHSEMYDPATDTWVTKTPMQVTRQLFFLGTVDGRIYAIGGSYPNPQNPTQPVILSSVEVYPASSELTGIDESRKNSKMPGDIFAYQNYPNPFFQHTTIPYSLQSRQKIGLNVLNIQGQQVAELVNEVKQPGDYTLTFDSGDLTEGIYFIRFMAGDYTQTIKCVLLKR